MNQIIEFANNNLLLIGGTVLMALAVMFYELRLKAGSVAALSSAQAVRLINNGARVVDIRNKDQYEQGHIVDSINIVESELEAERTKSLKKAKSVILVCDNGAKSAQCAATLMKNGMENVYNLQGGLTTWQRDNLPVLASGASATNSK
jgi:rhodanese-related sulfurtransferase